MVDLELVEQVFLLGIAKGRNIRPFHGYELGGACLAALCLHSNVEIEDSRRNSVKVLARSLTGCRTHDQCLTQISRKQRRQSAGFWVFEFSSSRQYRRVAKELCLREVLRQDGTRMDWARFCGQFKW